MEPISDSPLHSRTSSLSEDRFLLEKDGKFELVKTAEIKAIPLDIIIMETIVDTKLNTIKRTDIESVKMRTEINKAGYPKYLTKSLISEMKYEIESNSTSSLPAGKKAPTRLTTTTSRTSIQTRERPKTAPIYTLKELQDDGQTNRREQAEIAFLAWLDTKDKQLIQAKHLQPTITKPISNNRPGLSSNSDAYKIWLDNKKKQILLECKIKDEKAKTTTVNNNNTNINYLPQINFETWLQKKHNQYTKEYKPNVVFTTYRKKKAKSR